MSYQNIVGAALQRVEVSADRCTIALHTDRGVLTMQAEGDCCSRSWFESVDIDGVPGIVTKVDESHDAPEGYVQPPDNTEDHECLQVYFGTIFTDKGRTTFEMRNDSNGYYGGYIVTDWSDT